MMQIRVAELLLMPLTDQFRKAYTLLAVAGLPLYLTDKLWGIRWLEIAGIGLCAPFCVWMAVISLSVLPLLEIAVLAGSR